MVCSENYFSTATGLIHGGALSISRHLADLVITYSDLAGRTTMIEADHHACCASSEVSGKPMPACYRRPRRPLTRDT